ncbi:hypothetical protein R1flu_029195 [Riccia fluitans]|uniref:F-box domain-containing protein n=1 Tax=Riccia fluitans TaxID=41844 RepID=A0ABD1XNU5_9MARC
MSRSCSICHVFQLPLVRSNCPETLPSRFPASTKQSKSSSATLKKGTQAPGKKSRCPRLKKWSNSVHTYFVCRQLLDAVEEEKCFAVSWRFSPWKKQNRRVESVSWTRFGETNCEFRFKEEMGASMKPLRGGIHSEKAGAMDNTLSEGPVVLVDQGSEEDTAQVHDHQGLGDLPESCIAQILCLLFPREIARLACTSRGFRDAACSDLVWQAKLVNCYEDVLEEAAEAPAASSSKKSVYDFLCRGVFLKEGREAFCVDKATGGVCRSQGARGMVIVWGDDERYWSWLSREGSNFPEVAYLKAVCWLEARGQMECTLPVGSYTLSWRLSVAETPSRNRSYIRHALGYGWSNKPVLFDMETDGGQHSQREYYLDADRWEDEQAEQHDTVGGGSSQNSGRRLVHKNWMEFDVGNFTVEEGNGNSGVGKVRLKYALTEIKGGHWKSGMFLDGVVIRPVYLKPKCSLGDNLLEEADRQRVSDNTFRIHRAILKANH